MTNWKLRKYKKGFKPPAAFFFTTLLKQIPDFHFNLYGGRD